jgi:hypothetical protein
VKEKHNEKSVKIVFVPTEKMLADAMTKPLAGRSFDEAFPFLIGKTTSEYRGALSGSVKRKEAKR